MRKRDRDRAEALRLAGAPPSLRDRAVALAQERGEVRTRDLTDIGIPRCYLSRMCEEGLLVKVGYGRYCAAAWKAWRGTRRLGWVLGAVQYGDRRS
ncbi:type IV toxin-antitoxin system AbiEi family antitoxin domain-containing protein [Mesorhizobium sp. IMUNJ 23033]|uniref:type IV toxin-antitoxin system AbiEi family antitoxin domain-containing protein n=1 Tax=Mesorhizobium sp. IMUNJ 23033 TaxID=3378039 RepID=UPI0038517356